MSRLTEQYEGLFEQVLAYWRANGGYLALATSPFFHLSVFISALCYRLAVDGSWWTVTISLIPNLLGFSLGSYALVFSLLSPTMRGALAETTDDNGTPYFRSMNATFLHFISVQVVALTFSIIYKSSLIYDLSKLLPRIDEERVYSICHVAGGFLGLFLLCYSVITIFGAALHIWRLVNLTSLES